MTLTIVVLAVYEILLEYSNINILSQRIVIIVFCFAGRPMVADAVWDNYCVKNNFFTLGKFVLIRRERLFRDIIVNIKDFLLFLPRYSGKW